MLQSTVVTNTILTQAQSHSYSHTHTHTHTRVHAYIHTYIPTYTHISHNNYTLSPSPTSKSVTVTHFHRVQHRNRRQLHTFTESNIEIGDSYTLSQFEHSEMRNCQNHNVELAGRAQRYELISSFSYGKTTNHNVDSR